jgi:anti-sigma B factor antagonist
MHDVPSDFSVLTEVAGDRTQLTLRGELDMASLPELQEAVDAVRNNGAAARMLVDLRELSFLDSMGLEYLLRLSDVVELELVRGPRQVQRLFDIMELDTVLTFVDAPSDGA